MRSHDDWATEGFGLPPVAPRTSVFPGRGFLQVWWSHFGRGELRLVEDGDALLPLCHQPDGTISLVGDEGLTDYHTPLGAGAGALLGRYLHEQPPGTRFRFDSLPLEAARELAGGLDGVTREQHEAAFRIQLPDRFDAFLAGLSKKERHEMRRKRRRFEESQGPPQLLEGTPDPIGVFVAMHRLAPGRKGEFMTAEREGFFRDLAALPEARVDILAGSSGAPVAASLGFRDDAAFYLYNSAYDPAVAESSPGVVLLWTLFESVIGDGLSIFDFLKGDEAYKLRLGAEARPLFVLEGQT
jgi:CelD/BcsL family acetyltransferase involved in cellulose biosynthesis